MLLSRPKCVNGDCPLLYLGVADSHVLYTTVFEILADTSNINPISALAHHVFDLDIARSGYDT